MIIYWTFTKAYRKRKTRRRFTYFLNTDVLSPELKIAFDIAFECQERLRDSSLFVPLRKYFKLARKSNEKVRKKNNDHQCVSGLFFADEKGNFISDSQFAEILYDYPPSIQTTNRFNVPKNLSEAQARQLGVAELVPIQKEDFKLSHEQIVILNKFVELAMELKNSSIFKQHSPVVLQSTGGCYRVIYNIDNEQYIGSINSFRILYMQKESINFLRSVKILVDSRNIIHPVLIYMGIFRKEYLDTLDHKISKNIWCKHLIREIPENKLPTGKELLEAIMYTKYMHRATDHKTVQNYENIKEIIGDEAIVDYLFYILLYNLSIVIVNAGSWVADILTKLEEHTFTLPKPRIPDKVKDFAHFCDGKIFELAEIFWEKMNRPNGCKVSDFQKNARSFLEDFFQQDLSTNGLS
jgi:hypothetical protein